MPVIRPDVPGWRIQAAAREPAPVASRELQMFAIGICAGFAFGLVLGLLL